MKTFAFIAALSLILTFPIAYGNSKADTLSKHGNKVIFRIDRKFKGGEVEVVSVNGERVMREMLYKKKLIIDFGQVKSGRYIIKLKKGMLVQKHEYQKI